MLLDVRTRAELVHPSMWAEDRVHLNSAGHRALAYDAARVLGVPRRDRAGRTRAGDARRRRSPADRHVGDGEWIVRHAAPWLLRRLRGRAAGDGRDPKRAALAPVLDDPGDAVTPGQVAETRPLGSAAQPRLAPELALVVGGALRVLGAAAAVEVRLALALLRGLVLAVEGLAELALRLLGGAGCCSARRNSCLRVWHGCRAAERRERGSEARRSPRDIRRSPGENPGSARVGSGRPMGCRRSMCRNAARSRSAIANGTTAHRARARSSTWSRPAGSWSPVVDHQSRREWWTSTGGQRERIA